jgi:hypothetical protein
MPCTESGAVIHVDTSWTKLLRSPVATRVNGAGVGRRLAHAADVVELEHLIVAAEQNAVERGFVDFVVPHDVAVAADMHARLVHPRARSHEREIPRRPACPA